jgi:hypothetical protein
MSEVLIMAPESIFNFCVCNAHSVTLSLVRPFRHHQSALTPLVVCVIATTPACAPELYVGWHGE